MKLTLEDLRDIATTARIDHPGRVTIDHGVPEYGVPRRDRGIMVKHWFRDECGESRQSIIFHPFEFIPNPPGCRGIRNPKQEA